MNNGGLNRVDKRGMGHTGVHFYKFNSNVQKRQSPSPRKEATTFYYQSDGTGRDSYVLKNNGGLRFEYDVRNSGDRIFKKSLRSDQKSPVKHFRDPIADRADITTYLNWKSTNGRVVNARNSQIQRDLINRLTHGSPSRETTINYVVGTGEVGKEMKSSVPTFQGYKNSYREIKDKNAGIKQKLFSHAYGAGPKKFPSFAEAPRFPETKLGVSLQSRNCFVEKPVDAFKRSYQPESKSALKEAHSKLD
mmetsp:Transcript_34706/g.53233  ORF Transcript_34706/g.53233 Transcript_34706/m.53233 type:complete len:248 (-) Transcript_34706:765-1508(-)